MVRIIALGIAVLFCFSNVTAVPGEPFGVFATHVDGSVVSGSIAVTGWALDDAVVES